MIPEKTQEFKHNFYISTFSARMALRFRQVRKCSFSFSFTPFCNERRQL